MMKNLTVKEAHERLDILQDPKARLEKEQQARRAYENAFRDYSIYGIVTNALRKEPESGGGFLVPDQLETHIVDTLNEENVLRKLCKVIQTTKDMKFPLVLSHGKAGWIPEGEAVPVADEVFGGLVLSAYKMATSEVLSSEQLEDSFINFDAAIGDTLAARIADLEELSFLTGDGGSKPLGLLSQADVGATTEAANTVGIDDVMELVGSVKSGYQKNAVLLMNEATLYTLLRIRTAYGRSIWQLDPKKALPDKLFKYPIVISNAMPNIASGSKPIAFGDFSRVLIGDRGRHHVKRLNEVRAKTDQVEFILTKRVDIKLMDKEALRTLQVA